MTKSPVSVDVTLLRPIRERLQATSVPEKITPLADGTEHPPVNLRDRTARYPCPGCGTPHVRYANGSMAYHGASNARGGRRCTHPEIERSHLTTVEGLQEARQLWPALAPVYDAIQAQLARVMQRAHGGQLRNPDKKNPRWRWQR